MKTIRTIGILLLAMTLLAACDAPDDNLETIDETLTETSAETAPDSPYAEIENGAELWLKIGLEAYLTDKIPEFDAAAYFSEPANMTMLTLANDMHNYDSEAFNSVSALVYRYIMDTHGYDALFDLTKRVEYKDEWLRSLDSSLSYMQDIEAEAILSEMICESDAEYDNIVTLDGAVYYFTSYHETVNPSMAHLFLYQNTRGLRSLREVIAEIDPDGKYFDTNVPINYLMEFDGMGFPAYKSNGYIIIGKYDDLLASAVQTMLNKGDEDSLWIAQGLAEIYGKAMDMYYLSVYDRAFYLNPTYIEEYVTPMAEQGNHACTFHLGTARNYYGENGIYEHGDDGIYTIDSKLYTHAAALSEIESGYFYSISDILITSCDGHDLSRTQAASFVLYLIEQASEEAVFDVYLDYGKFEYTFGGKYDEIKAAWLDWLEEKFTK